MRRIDDEDITFIMVGLWGISSTPVWDFYIEHEAVTGGPTHSYNVWIKDIDHNCSGPNPFFRCCHFDVNTKWCSLKLI